MNHPRLSLLAATLVACSASAQQTALQKQDTTLAPPKGLRTKLPPGYTIPTVDISAEKARQVVVDREAGQYLGHPTTVLLEDDKTMLIVYPKGHGRGAIVYKRSTDGGKTWSERLPTPKSWETSLEVPTLHRVVDAAGKKRIIMFSGLYPIRMAVTEDDGLNWSELKPIGDFGGVVTMATVIGLKTPGQYLAFFHDDGRFIRGGTEGKYTVKGPHSDHTSPAAKPWRFWVYTTLSKDGGLTWSVPAPIAMLPDASLCEPGVLRSPDGKQIAVLLRENSRKYNSFVIFSNDEGLTWSEPGELPASLTGDRHTAKYAPDGRLFISFRDTTHVSPTKGDWVGWVGRYEDIVNGSEGQYRVRIMDNTKGVDCTYPGVELLPDGTFVTTTYGHWTEGEPAYVVSVRFKLEELDKKLRGESARVFPKDFSKWMIAELSNKQTQDAYYEFLNLAGRSKYEWSIFEKNGKAEAVLGEDARITEAEVWPDFDLALLALNAESLGDDLKPFEKMFRFPHSVLKVDDGWLMAYNAGEFGGTFWWYSGDGKRRYEISRHRINQLIRQKGRIFAVEGASYHQLNDGSMIEVVRKKGKWHAETFVQLPTTGEAIAKMGEDEFCVVTPTMLLVISLQKRMEILIPVAIWAQLYPRSVAVDPDGKIYVGMRQFVGRFDLNAREKGLELLVPDESFLNKTGYSAVAPPKLDP